jgi:hypothetical protein
VLWVLEASARVPFDLRSGARHAVWASSWVRAVRNDRPVVRGTFLVEADAEAALAGLVPPGAGAWDVAVRPAPDGTYPDAETRRALLVRDGAVVAVRGP